MSSYTNKSSDRWQRMEKRIPSSLFQLEPQQYQKVRESESFAEWSEEQDDDQTLIYHDGTKAIARAIEELIEQESSQSNLNATTEVDEEDIILISAIDHDEKRAATAHEKALPRRSKKLFLKVISGLFGTALLTALIVSTLLAFPTLTTIAVRETSHTLESISTLDCDVQKRSTILAPFGPTPDTETTSVENVRNVQEVDSELRLLPITFQPGQSTVKNVDEMALSVLTREMMSSPRIRYEIVGFSSSEEARSDRLRRQLAYRRASVALNLIRSNGPSRRRMVRRIVQEEEELPRSLELDGNQSQGAVFIRRITP